MNQLPVSILRLCRIAAVVLAMYFASMCGPVSVRSQIPALISNQGRLYDGQEMIDGHVSLVLRVFTNATQGTFLYEDVSRVEVVDGYYSTFMGDHTTFGSLQDALSYGEAYVEVSVDSVVFPPRELISSVAYSFRAGEADGLTRGALTANMIGESVVFEAHLADESVSSRVLEQGAVTGADLADDSVTVEKLAPKVRAKLDRALEAAEGGGAGERARATAVRIDPRGESPTIVAGHIANRAGAGASGVVVGGGGKVDEPNEARANFSTVDGGAGNRADGDYSTVGGGWFNKAKGQRAVVAGGRLNQAGGSSASVGGGYSNVADGNYAAVGGGYSNQATGYVAAVGGGWANQASGPVSTIGGGQENVASGPAASVVGGWSNQASEFGATAAGGFGNHASGSFSAVGGGSNNVASGAYATVPGGHENFAEGVGSLAAGRQAHAEHDGSFVWADSQPTEFSSTRPDQVLLRARGNVGIDTMRPDEKLTVAGNVAPARDNVHDLGSDELRWRKLHLVDGVDASQNLSVTSGGSTNLTVMTNGVIWVPGTVVARQLVGDGSGITGLTSSVLSDDVIVDRMIHKEAEIAPSKVAGGALTKSTQFGGDVRGDYDHLVLQPGSVDEQALAKDSVSAGKIPDASLGLEKLTQAALEQLQPGEQEDVWSVHGNEVDGSVEAPFLGTRNAQSLELRVDGRRALRIEPAPSPNLVGGYEKNSLAGSVLGATISGGGGTAGAHRVTGNYGTVGGGLGNNIGNEYATVAGGINNTAAGSAATVAGGWKNAANDLDATVGGGQDNVAGGSASTVAGGFNNRATGNYSAIPGGISNQTQGDYAMAAGRGAHANHDGSFVWADSSSEEMFASTAADQYLIRASGNVGIDIVSPPEKLTVAGNVAPARTDRFSLGSSALRWRRVYLSLVDVSEVVSFASGDEVIMSLDPEGHLMLSGSVEASTFVGDGSGLSGISGSALTQGSITDGQISQLAAIDPRKIKGIALTEDSRMSGDVQGTPKSLILRDGTVRGAKLADGAVTATKIGQSSIGPEHLTDELRSSLNKAPTGWKLGGNKGTQAERDFIGTLDGEPFQVHVGHRRALRLEPTSGAPNVVLGAAHNQVARGASAAVVSGGGSAASPNRVQGSYGTVGGGVGNEAGDEYATVSGGFGNRARGFDTTVGGGQDNDATGSGSTIGGGFTNRTSGSFSTIAGGADNRVGGNVAVVSGGFANRADGAYSAVTGGSHNEAAAEYTQAAGRRAKAVHPGAWVWGDSKDADFSSTRNDQFLIRAAGGVGIGMNRPQYLLHLAGGAYSDGLVWANASDENLKEDFEPVEAEDMLQRISELAIHSWKYKTDETDARHIGPTAQDFRATFGFGGDDKSISTVDAQGVAFVAIQALAKQNIELKKSNEELQRRLEAMEKHVEQGGPAKSGSRRL